MNSILRLLIILFVIAPISSLQSQEKLMERANKKFDQYEFVDSQKIYLRLAEEGYESADLFARLGDAYYFNADYANAAIWYERLVNSYAEETTPDQYFRYAQALRSEENYEQSKVMLDRYDQMLEADSREGMYGRADVEEARKGYIRGTYNLEKLRVNALGYSDFAPAYYGEKLLFASTRDSGSFTKKVHKWNNQPFLELYTTSRDGSEVPVKLKGAVNSPYHESTAALSPDGNTLYFTRNNYTDNDYASDPNGTNKLKIYKSVKNEDGEWEEAMELPFNSNDYSVSHPSISQDGKILYFASDMPGTLGASDLWKVTINENGAYGEIENLGSKINTPGRETFPYISTDGDLYFSSDGRPGLGGLDVFVLDQDDATVYNVGEPVNSPQDDFSFIIDDSDNTGYFASNRGNDPLDDDIYSFIKEACESTVLIKVVDANTNEPLSGARISIRNEDNEVVATGETSGVDATYLFENPDCEENYFIRAELEEYATAEKSVSVPKESTDLEVTIMLEKAGFELEPGSDIAQSLNLNPIYFDFDKSNIRPDAAVELAKIIAVMKEYDDIRLDVRSHTDSRGNDTYNEALSERRNKSTINYIANEGGISRDRLSGRGYGESQLLNECSNGVECTAEQHQLNRRSEFIIMQNEE